MNKLLVSDIIELNNGIYELNIKSNNLNINVSGNTTIYLINEIVSNLNINIKDNSILNIYKFNNNKENNLNINVIQNNNTEFYYYESFINNMDNKLVINNNINGNNNKSNIIIRNICNKDNSDIIINLNIKDNTKDNIALEDLKGINNGGFIHIEPNIICNSNEVLANHLTTIGYLNIDDINYLMSKGISEFNAKKILLNGFIFSKMDEYIKKLLGGEIIE